MLILRGIKNICPFYLPFNNLKQIPFIFNIVLTAPKNIFLSNTIYLIKKDKSALHMIGNPLFFRCTGKFTPTEYHYEPNPITLCIHQIMPLITDSPF